MATINIIISSTYETLAEWKLVLLFASEVASVDVVDAGLTRSSTISRSFRRRDTRRRRKTGRTFSAVQVLGD